MGLRIVPLMQVVILVSTAVAAIAGFALAEDRANEPPKIKIVVVPDGLQDEAYSYTFTATDPDNTQGELNWSDDTDLFDISSAGIVSFTPVNGDVGFNYFNLTVTDPGGLSDTHEFTLFVANLNDPPTLRPILPQTANEDRVWTLNLSKYVDDPDLLLPEELRDRISYRDDTPRVVTHIETGVITWDAPTNDDAAVGDFYFKVTVQDSKGRYAEREVKITVLNTNDPPKIGTISKQFLLQDAPYSYVIPATDDDLEVPLANELISFTNNHIELFTINASSGLISFTPVNNQVGVWQVDITVTDVIGASTTSRVVFEVVNENDPPELEQITPQLLTEDLPYEYQVVVNDPDLEPRLLDGKPVDPNERLEFRTNSTKVPIDRYTGRLSFTPTQSEVGEYTVRITVVDHSSATRTMDVMFKVANVNDPPRNVHIVGIYDGQILKSGKTINLIGSAVDDDDTSSELTYIWYADIGVIGNYSIIYWTPEGDGPKVVTLKVLDPNGGEGNTSIWVVIEKPLPTPTVLYPIPGSVVEDDDAITISLDFNRSGLDPTKEYTITLFSNVTGELKTLGPDDALEVDVGRLPEGKHRITVTLSDGTNHVSTYVNITVKAASPKDDTPGPGFVLAIVVILSAACIRSFGLKGRTADHGINEVSR